MGKRTNTAVWLEKYNRWQIKVQKDGIRKTFTSSTLGRTGQREANKKADEWLDENLDSQGKNVSCFCEQLLKELNGLNGTDDYVQTEKAFRLYVKPALGTIKADKLTEQHFQSVLNKAYKEKQLSKKYLLNIRYAMKRLLKFMRKSKATNLVFEDLKIPHGAKVKVKTILQPNDIKTLFSTDKTVKYGKPIQEWFINAYRYQAITGIRPGECVGLKWGDIDGSNTKISRSINRYGETTTGKNENAIREFANSEFAKTVLENQRKMLSANRIASAYVFPDECGEAVKQDKYYKRWVRYRDYNSMSEASPYELRHTFVSIAKKIPEGMLKSLVGHSKDMDTFGVYGHEVQGEKEAAAVLLEDIFKEIITNESPKDESGD